MESNIIQAQKGFQTKVLSSSADIVICGGSGGAGKTAVLLLDGARWQFVAGYGAVIFRRSYPEIVMQDGLWDQSKKFYGDMGGVSNETQLRWTFPSGARIAFSHLQYETDLLKHQGSQYAFIGFDELTHFSKKEFMYLLSRNRSVCGVDPVIRATCNPDPDSWVAEFIAWFIDQETGFPITERGGKLRYFTTDNGTWVWGDTPEEVRDKCPHLFETEELKATGIDPLTLVKSMTFIPGSVYENKVLLSADPRYLGNLMALDEEDKLRLLDGNWKMGLDVKELFPLPKLNDMFNAYPPLNRADKYYITIDHARFGRDNCVIFTWHGWRVVRIDVLPLSNSNDIIKVIQHIRQQHRPIPISNIIVDQDGIGVADILGGKVYQGGAAPEKETIKRANEHFEEELEVIYRNKRTQNYFKVSEKVEAGLISVDLNECYIWTKHPTLHHLAPPLRIKELKIKGESFTIERLIKDDLRTVKRYKSDGENKKMITPKEQQKNAIGGRSPDFGDNFSMRVEFDWIPVPQYIRKRVA